MNKKLKSNKGETIVETLVALAICVICITFLTDVIVKAEVVNSQLRNYDYSFNYKTDEQGYDNSTVTIDYSDLETDLNDSTIEVKEKTDNGFNYYEK